MKYVALIGDGMADYPIAEWDNRTPLEAARTSNMDFIAKNGRGGFVRHIPNACPAGSDVAALSILGYNPKKYYTGRGPLEAASAGYALRKDEMAFRCNLVTIAGGEMADYSGGHISSEEGKELIKALNERFEDREVRFISGVSYRNLMIVNQGLLDQGRGKLITIPPHDISGKQVDEYLPQGKGSKFLREIMDESFSVLNIHEINTIKVDLSENPSNMIWLWGQGSVPNLPAFEQKYKLKGAVISAVDLIKGIAHYLKMDSINVPGATGYLDTNYRGKGEYALRALEKYDFVMVHVEAPDEAGHNGDKMSKVQAIESFDSKVVGTILEGIKKFPEYKILVMPDHYTPVSLKTHSREPVPFAMYGTNVKADRTQKFSEVGLKKGKMGTYKGHKLLKKFFETK